MGTKMKGLLKGLRNIFDEKEQGMQIGFPTDVKHVAHIGWDGPSMGEYESTSSGPVTGSANRGTNELAVSLNCSSQAADLGLDGGAHAVVPSRRSTSSDVPNRECKSSEKPKHSRRHQSTPDSDSLARESTESRKVRRERRTSTGSGSNSDSATSSATQDPPGVPKTRQRKAKGSTTSKEGSARPSRTKAAASDQGSEQLSVSPLKPKRESTEVG